MYYTDSHEWVKIENGIGVVGISEFARRELGEVVYVELPQNLPQNESFTLLIRLAKPAAG